MGINIIKLRSNILKFLNGQEILHLRESAIKLANLLNSNKINNLIFLCYSQELKKFLFWCQQLIAESLGKKNKGFLPMISNVPKDHHSLLQLYLDGPKDKLFYIFSTKTNKKMKIKNNSFGKAFNYVENKEYSKVKEAQKKALIKIFKNKNIPYQEFQINKINEETLGELFSYFIVETVLIGKLLNINPFNQPAVEDVKILTKKYLS